MLRIVKLFISIFFLVFQAARNFVRSFIGKHEKPYAIVLYYHSISKENRKAFARQLDSILRWTHPISSDSTDNLLKGKRYVSITFDDGFVSVIQYAFPELIQRSIPATMFIPSGMLGKNPPWLADTCHKDKDEKIATEKQVMEMSKLPGITIGSHCVSHSDILTLSNSVASNEIKQSKIEIERIIGKPVGLLSFPHGNYNEYHVGVSKEAGYRRAFSISPVKAFANPNEFIIGRTAANPTDWQIEFWLKIMGGYLWLPQSFILKRRLISFFHVLSANKH